MCKMVKINLYFEMFKLSDGKGFPDYLPDYLSVSYDYDRFEHFID